MEFFFVRHGRMTGDPHARRRPPVTGHLSPEGEAQAAALSRALAGVTFDGVFVSPLGRAIQTAQGLRRASGVEMEVHDWLEEWRPAHLLDGGPDTRYEALQRAAAELRPEQSWKTIAGEGALEMAARIVPGWIALLDRLGLRAGHGGLLPDNPDDARTFAVVAHGGSLGLLLAFVLGIPMKPYPPIAFSETGVAVVQWIRRVDVWYPQLRIPPPGWAQE
jgi:broad specificity phosphatase PhoE